MRKSLVYIDDFSKEEIYEIFKLADGFADGCMSFTIRIDEELSEGEKNIYVCNLKNIY